MVLSDTEILELILTDQLVFTPLISATRQIGTSSVDVRLGTEFRMIRIDKQTHFDLDLPTEKIRDQIRQYTEHVHVEPLQPFILHPNEFALASTLEYIILPQNIAGRLDGRSTWGRVGLQVHSTAGLVDPGFEGTLTFELHNMGKLPLPLFPGVRIAQISFYPCVGVSQRYSDRPDSKYARSTATLDTMFYEDFEYRQIQERIRSV